MPETRAEELAAAVRACPWLMAALTAVRASALPDAWIGAGVLRDLVWDERYGAGFDAARVRDVDVAFFDPTDLSPDRDRSATALLTGLQPGVPWEATNQAAVHTWYAAYFGGAPVAPLTSVAEPPVAPLASVAEPPVAPLTSVAEPPVAPLASVAEPPVAPLASVAEAVGTWPETATSVAVRLGPGDRIEVCAPHGLADLLDGVWRRNPRRITLARSRERLARQHPATRWPGVRVIEPA
jgi:hypothetical protein